MVNSNVPVYSTENFRFRKGVFITFASDINFHPARIYDDACDIGFWLKNPKTGNKILFVEEGVKRDRENDVQYWLYSAHCLYENVSTVHHLKVHIFND